MALPAGTPATVAIFGSRRAIPAETPTLGKNCACVPRRTAACSRTASAARAIDRVPKLGTLQVGAPGDVTMLELVEGPVEFVDTRNNKRAGKVSLRPVQTVSAGIAFGRPYSAPFSVR